MRVTANIWPNYFKCVYLGVWFSCPKYALYNVPEICKKRSSAMH